MAVKKIKNFNLADNQKAERKLLVTAVNVGTADAPVFQVVGAGVEDSSIEFNPDTETVTDILGVTETTVNKLEISQDLDPMTVRGGSKLAFKLHDIYSRKAMSEFSQFEVLTVFAYLESEDSTSSAKEYYAELHKGCTLTPQSLGGSGYNDMPINISLSNDKKLGFVNSYKFNDEITFTENADGVEFEYSI